MIVHIPRIFTNANHRTIVSTHLNCCASIYRGIRIMGCVIFVEFVHFTGEASSSTVRIDTLKCTRYNSLCQANVVLIRRLEPGRYYDFRVTVKDTQGGMATQSCSITATNYTTPHDIIFPHKTGIIMVPEVRPHKSENTGTDSAIEPAPFCCFDC